MLITIIVLNVLAFVASVATAGSFLDVVDSEVVQYGALWPPAVAHGQWWRLVTGGFLHTGIIHIALNMIALWMLGSQLEPFLGRARFVALYLLSLLGGAAAVMLTDQPATIGASGAVFGLMAAFLVVLVRMRQPLSAIVPTIVLNVVLSVAVPGISLAGHVGGFVAGALATAAMLYAPPRLRTPALVGLGVVLLVACAIGAGATGLS